MHYILSATWLYTKGDRLADVQWELDQNRKKWLSKLVSNYQFNFRWECYCGQEYVKPVSISVRENRIVDVAFVTDNVPFTIGTLWKYRTVDGLFDLLQKGINQKAYSISAEYHPEFGYPMDFWIDYEKYTVDEELGFDINGLSIE